MRTRTDKIKHIKTGILSVVEEDKGAAISAYLAKLSGRIERLILVYSVPEVDWNLPRLDLSWFRSGQSMMGDFATLSLLFQRRSQFVENVVDGQEKMT